jgi:hypothetical protein
MASVLKKVESVVVRGPRNKKWHKDWGEFKLFAQYYRLNADCGGGQERWAVTTRYFIIPGGWAVRQTLFWVREGPL